MEESAIAGHPTARFSLGAIEWKHGSQKEAAKHPSSSPFNQGHSTSVEMLKQGSKEGLVRKEDFAAALRAHQAAVDAMKIPRRENHGSSAPTLSAKRSDYLIISKLKYLF